MNFVLNILAVRTHLKLQFVQQTAKFISKQLLKINFRESLRVKLCFITFYV